MEDCQPKIDLTFIQWNTLYFWILQVQFRSAEVIKNKRNLQTPPWSRVIILLSNSTGASSVFRPSTVARTRDSELRSHTRAMLTPSWQSAEVVWTSLIMGQLVVNLIDFTLLTSNFLLQCKKYSVPDRLFFTCSTTGFEIGTARLSDGFGIFPIIELMSSSIEE